MQLTGLRSHFRPICLRKGMTSLANVDDGVVHRTVLGHVLKPDKLLHYRYIGGERDG